MKRISALILSLALLAGCAAPAAPETGAVRTVTDVWGREVAVPETVETIACVGSGAPRMAAYLGVMDRLVGAEDHDLEGETPLRDYSPAWYDALKDLPSVGAGGGSGANNAYPEELITLGPDVILAGFSAEAADELQSQTGIPVVCVRYISNGLADESFYAALEVFAGTVGAEERCEALLAYIDACKADLAGRTADLPAEARPTVYAGAVTFNGRHGFTGTYSHFGPLDAVGAVNVADTEGQEGYYETDREQVLTWDPDVIFVDFNGLSLINEDYASNPDFYNSLTAVKEGRVYSQISFRYSATNTELALADAYYMGKVLYPEEFADVDMAAKFDEIFETMLGVEDACAQYQAAGYELKEMTLGE